MSNGITDKTHVNISLQVFIGMFIGFAVIEATALGTYYSLRNQEDMRWKDSLTVQQAQMWLDSTRDMNLTLHLPPIPPKMMQNTDIRKIDNL